LVNFFMAFSFVVRQGNGGRAEGTPGQEREDGGEDEAGERQVDDALDAGPRGATQQQPPTQVAIMIERLKTLDCTDVATSPPCSTCLLTAVWYIVTSGPNARPQRKKAMCEMPPVPPNARSRAIEMQPMASMTTMRGRR
jgi:hypothetical protein